MAKTSLTIEQASYKASVGITIIGFISGLIGVLFFAYNFYMIDKLNVAGEPITDEFQSYNILLWVFLGSAFMVIAAVMTWFAYSYDKLHAFIPGFVITLIGAISSIFISIIMVYIFNTSF